MALEYLATIGKTSYSNVKTIGRYMTVSVYTQEIDVAAIYPGHTVVEILTPVRRHIITRILIEENYTEQRWIQQWGIMLFSTDLNNSVGVFKNLDSMFSQLVSNDRQKTAFKALVEGLVESLTKHEDRTEVVIIAPETYLKEVVKYKTYAKKYVKNF